MNSNTKKVLSFYFLGFSLAIFMPNKNYFNLMNNIYASIQNSMIRIDNQYYYSLI